MRVGGISNMLEDSPLENDAVLPALTHQPWQIDSRVDADGCEERAVVNARIQLIRRNFTELQPPVNIVNSCLL